MNKEFERYNTKIEIPASVVLETIFSSDNKDVETLSRWSLKYGFVDLVEKEDGKYYKLQDDYEKQSFYTYLSKKERKQYEYEDYLIKQIDEKEQEMERLNTDKEQLTSLVNSCQEEIRKLKSQLQQKENIIKEVREYIKLHIRKDEEYPDYMEMLKYEYKELLEILGSDKE